MNIRPASLTGITLAGFIALCAGTPAFASVYVTASNGQFGTVNTSNGDFSFHGDTSDNPLTGIANLNGTIYGENASNGLVTINPSTAATTIIGPSGVSFAVTAGSGDSFFGLDGSNNLYSINLTTGAATLIGSTGIAPLSGTYTNSLAGNGTELFYTEQLSSMASTLFSINETTGASSAIGLTGINDIAGSAFDDGTLYGFISPFFDASTIPSIYTIDTSTGAATFDAVLDPTLGDVFGSTPVPEPITISLFGAALAGAVAMRRRKKAAKV